MLSRNLPTPCCCCRGLYTLCFYCRRLRALCLQMRSGKALPFFCRQVGHGGDGLNGLAQAHFITEEDAFLCKDIAGPEGLVCAQVSFKGGKVQRCRIDPGGKLRGDAAVNHFLRGRDPAPGFQPGIIRRTVFFKIRNSLFLADLYGIIIERQKVPDTSAQRTPVKLQQRTDRQKSPFLFLPSGKDPPETVTDLHGLYSGFHLSMKLLPQRFRVPADKSRFPAPGKQGDQHAAVGCQNSTGRGSARCRGVPCSDARSRDVRRRGICRKGICRRDAHRRCILRRDVRSRGVRRRDVCRQPDPSRCGQFFQKRIYEHPDRRGLLFSNPFDRLQSPFVCLMQVQQAVVARLLQRRHTDPGAGIPQFLHRDICQTADRLFPQDPGTAFL